MAQIKHTINKNAKDLANAEPTGGKRYAGKTPPKGVYKGVLKQFGVRMKNGKPQKNTNGDLMLKGLVEITETGAKAKYNGYPIWFNQNVSDQGAPYVNQMLDAISGGSAAYRTAFWEKFVVIDEKGLITRVGKSRYADGSVNVVVSAKDGTDNNGQRNLDIGAWLLPTSAEPDDDEDEDEDDIDVEIEDDDEDDDDESDDSDEDDADDDDDEDDEDESDEDEDEDDDEEDDEDEEEEEEDEPDAAEARLEELKALDRPALVKIAKSLSVKTGKSRTNEDLISDIIEAEENDDEPPF